MLKNYKIFLYCAILAFCHSASIVDKLNIKCGVTDTDCWLKFHIGVLKEIIDNGEPDMKIPALDPFVIKNMEFKPFGLLKVTIVDGKAIGIKSCHLIKVNVNMEDLKLYIDLSCEKIAVEGHITLETMAEFKNSVGSIDVHGDGNGGAVVYNLQISLEIAFQVKKHGDGQLYYELLSDDSTYTYKIGKLTVSAENTYIGKQEISTVLVNIFNENWEVVVKAFGATVSEKVVEQVYKEITKFYNNVPVNQITSDDLSSYVTP